MVADLTDEEYEIWERVGHPLMDHSQEIEDFCDGEPNHAVHATVKNIVRGKKGFVSNPYLNETQREENQFRTLSKLCEEKGYEFIVCEASDYDEGAFSVIVFKVEQ